MVSNSTVLERILPRSALDLGWFVTNTDDPLQNYYFLPDKTAPAAEPVMLTNFSESYETGSATGFGAFLTKALSAGCSLKQGVTVDLMAAQNLLLTLPNSEDWFETACASVQLRQWYERKLERIGPLRLRVNLIVGLRVLRNIKFVLHQSKATGARAEATVPVSAMFGDPGVLGNLTDAGAYANHETSSTNQQSFEAKELIYAVQYRRVKFNWLFSKDLDRTRLSSSTYWKVMATDAGGTDDEDEAEDVIEAVLCNEEVDTDLIPEERTYKDESGDVFVLGNSHR